MFKTWTTIDTDLDSAARDLEAHLNEFAEVVESVSYTINDGHHYVLAVYRPVEPASEEQLEAAVSIAEEIVEEAQV